MQSSNFQKVIIFNKTFGITVNDQIKPDIFDNDKKLVKYRMDLIKEEISELEEATTNNDLVEIVDALADILYVVYGMGCSIGVDLDALFSTIYGKGNSLSNFTFIKEETNIQTIKNSINYNSFGVEFVNPIKEEFIKLAKYVDNKDFILSGISLAKLIYKTYIAGYFLNIDMDEAYNLVHESNMSKSCSSEEEAILTVNWYKENEKRYDSPDYRLSDDNKYWIIFNKSTGKILKNINYHPVNLQPLCVLQSMCSTQN